jgi:hypothetical protein
MPSTVAGRRALVVTSVNHPNDALRELAVGSLTNGFEFFLVGDTASPPDFQLDGCRFLDLPAQLGTGFEFAVACPVRHYARKNVGYLEAMRSGAEVILETDDDNHPGQGFFEPRVRTVSVAALYDAGWVNVYRYFSEATIWPRGLPLDCIARDNAPIDRLPVAARDCPIQQGLADENPDVDAIYRMVLPLPQRFAGSARIALGAGSWCPFNSQNTLWWRDAYPLMYLPAHCPFRMTDIWRSFVAQRIAWAQRWHVLFHGPTVRQERNAHDLMRDFEDEVAGYLNNRRIAAALTELEVAAGVDQIPDNMLRSYEVLVRLGVIGRAELPLLETWLEDVNRVRNAETGSSKRCG